MKKAFCFAVILSLLVGIFFSGCQKVTDDVLTPSPVERNDVNELAKKGKGGDIRVPADYTTIQEAVDAAVSGEVIAVSPGTYVEQVSIIDKDIHLVGAEGAIIEAPSSMSVSVSNYYAIIYVNQANVTFSGFKVDGKGLGNSHYRFVGVFYYNAGGRIDRCEVIDVRDTPFSGRQHGLAIYAYNNEEGIQEIFITNNKVTDFQKNGITINGNWPHDYYSANPAIATYSNIKAHVNNNEVTGAGPSDVIAQNCIQFGRGASGEIKNNVIKYSAYTGEGWAATGILGYYPYTVMVQRNNVYDCDPPVYFSASPSCKIINNEFISVDLSEADPWGVLISGTDNIVTNNTFTDFYVGVYIGSSYYGDTYNTKAVTNRFYNVDYPVIESDVGLVDGTKERATKIYND